MSRRKTKKDACNKQLQHANGRLPEDDRQPVLPEPQSRIMTLQHTAGNQATIRFLDQNAGAPASVPGLKLQAHFQTGTGRRLSQSRRQWLERSAGPLPPIYTKDTRDVQQALMMTNVNSATQGNQILAGRDAFVGIEGQNRLAHEVAHVLQQHSPNLPLASQERAEADAHSFANSVMKGSPATVNVAAPIGLAYDTRRLQSGDQVKSITFAENQAIFYMKGADGSDYVITYFVKHNIPPREEPYKLRHGKDIVGLPREIKGWISFGKVKNDDPVLTREHFPAEVDLTVREKGAVSDIGDGRTETSGAKDPVPAPDKTKGIKAPIIKISDIKQIEELKRKGLIPVETADQIKAKFEKKETLTYEEAVSLIDAFNRVIVSGEGKEWKEAQESWLKWAKFIEENKDKISGRVKTGDKGISVEEVKEILKKHKEYVGVKEAPARTTKAAVYDPELRKSWNSLNDWEKKLWKEYLEKYGYSADVTDPSTKDLRITKAVRFSMALRMSPKYMPGGASEAAEQLFNDPIFLGGTIAGITAYLALWLVPEPVFTKAAAVLTTIGLLSLVAFSASEIINLASTWMTLSDDSAKSTKLEDLEKAAEKFGKSIGGSGLRILVALATIFAGKVLPAPKPLPPPSGGGGMVAAGAGGPNVVVGRPVAVPAVKVLADGTIVIVGPPTAGMAMASVQGGGGGTTRTPAHRPASTATGKKTPLQKLQEWEYSGKIKGNWTRLKNDLQSNQRAVRKAAEAEVKALEVKIRSGQVPEEVPLVPGKSVLREFDIDKYGTFTNRPGDRLAGHEMLQNAWMKAKGYIKGHGTGSASRENPAVAMSRDVHTAVGREQAKLGLHDPKKLVNQTALENIELNARAMRNAGVPEPVIQALKTEALKHAANVTGSSP